MKRCKEAHAPVQLIVREGKGHGWPGMEPDLKVFADWFDEHLRRIKASEFR